MAAESFERIFAASAVVRRGGCASRSSRCSGRSAAEAFKVRLTPVPIEASTAAKTTGNGRASASLDGSTLTVTGSFAGLQGAATVAGLHEGPVLGVRGPAVAEFTVPQSASGSFNARVQAHAVASSKACTRGGCICRSTAPRRRTATSGVGCCRERNARVAKREE